MYTRYKVWSSLISRSGLFVILLLSACGGNVVKSGSVESDSSGEVSDTSDISVVHKDRKHAALLKAYPDLISDIKDNKVFFSDGSSIEYDDGKEKDFAGRLDDSDVEDMFFVRYTLPESVPEYQADAGRSRSEALFKKMYGSTAREVESNLVNVNWFGNNVKFTKINGAADSLRSVAGELENYPELKDYLQSSGTYYWRQVRGANRMSAHSYGIAFDIAVNKADYWQWNGKTNDEYKEVKYANKIPRELVKVFQRHGFIWGGAWYHYDTMHFEFRPEILNYADAE